MRLLLATSCFAQTSAPSPLLDGNRPPPVHSSLAEGDGERITMDRRRLASQLVLPDGEDTQFRHR